MKSKVCSIAACILFLVSCSSQQPKGFKNAGSENIEHKGSGTIFPEKVGVFNRTNVMAYDNSGRNISVGYRIGSSNCATEFTMYIYPKNNGSVELEMKNAEIGIMHFNKNVVLIEKTQHTIRQGNKEYTGERHVYTFRQNFYGTPTDVQSEVLVFEHNNRFWKYRITFPEKNKDCSVKHMFELMDALTWGDK